MTEKERAKSSEENYKRMKKQLDERLNADSRLKVIAEKINLKTADFKDTAEYSEIVSKYISEVIQDNIGEITVPLGKQFVCNSLLKDHYERINGVLGTVQASVDEKLNIHIAPQKAPFPLERVMQVAHSLEDPTVPPETIVRRAGAPVENVAKSFHDDYIKKNAKFRNDAGLKCYLVRTTDGNCCDWCTQIAGRYDYATAPDDIFRRHDNCGCTTIYENGRQRQDVWTKKSWEVPEIQDKEYKPTVFDSDQAKELEKKNLQYKGLTGDDGSGIIKALTIDDFELRSYGKGIDGNVLETLWMEIRLCEKDGNFTYSDILFDSLGGNDKGTFALQTEMLPNGLLRLNVNTEVFAGQSLMEINQRFSNTESILANNIHEALIHEKGHAKSMKGKLPFEVDDMHKKLRNIHISGINECAYSDGAECIAEVEILLDRKDFIPKEAINLYKEYVK